MKKKKKMSSGKTALVACGKTCGQLFTTSEEKLFTALSCNCQQEGVEKERKEKENTGKIYYR